MDEHQNRELTTREAAELAGVSDAHIRRLLIAQKLKGRKLNNWVWLVRRSEIERWLAEREKG